jgi:hypothetical protein
VRDQQGPCPPVERVDGRRSEILRVSASGTAVAFVRYMKDLQTSESGPHVDNVKRELHALVAHLRRDAELLGEPQAAALFETSAEVIQGLELAFDHFKARSEAAWQKQGAAGKPPR